MKKIFIILFLSTTLFTEVLTFTGMTVDQQGEVNGISIVGQTFDVQIDFDDGSVFNAGLLTLVNPFITLTINGVDNILDQDGGNYFIRADGNTFQFEDEGVQHVFFGQDNDEIGAVAANDGESFTQFLNRSGFNNSLVNFNQFGINSVNPGTLNNGVDNITNVIFTGAQEALISTEVNAVPEPSTYILIILLGVTLLNRKKNTCI
ncbi:PEP-CTERM sorting domain-containing protein [Candidatus Uabimicrobium sp. HlEnr_7]|uniref:PEP-CTERM sorting domain-containing protein n=1 Tax=Candidatus Uabimicrobium helgolandensis TaxID=3095367 RepID=UPI003557DFEA